MRGLVRVDPDHHCCHGKLLPFRQARTVAGTPNSRNRCGVHASFEPRHGEVPAGWHVVRKPAPPGGRRLESQAYRDLLTLGPGSLPSRPGPAPSTKSLNWAVIACRAPGCRWAQYPNAPPAAVARHGNETGVTLVAGGHEDRGDRQGEDGGTARG